MDNGALWCLGLTRLFSAALYVCDLGMGEEDSRWACAKGDRDVHRRCLFRMRALSKYWIVHKSGTKTSQQ